MTSFPIAKRRSVAVLLGLRDCADYKTVTTVLLRVPVPRRLRLKPSSNSDEREGLVAEVQGRGEPLDRCLWYSVFSGFNSVPVPSNIDHDAQIIASRIKGGT